MSTDCTAVNLVRYAERIGYRCNAFFGINHPDNFQYACRELWTQAQRMMVQDALAQAQALLEEELRYPLCPTWFADERHSYAPVIMATWGKIIQAGVKSTTTIQAAVAVNHAADPATVTVNGVTCDEDEIHIYHPGTDEEIIPESVAVSAGHVLTVTIPWCRMVSPAYADNPETGLQYADVATWISHTVDVYCITNDPATQATLVVAPGAPCTCSPSTEPCTDTEYAACIHLRKAELGTLDVHRADYAAGVWTAATLCYCPSWVDINYQAGLTSLPRTAEDMIIRLAHSLMAEEPCGCDVTQRLWRRDRNVPVVLTRERINNPWGLSDGAWAAWMWAQTAKLRRGSVL